jgi:hypothetical protein
LGLPDRPLRKRPAAQFRHAGRGRRRGRLRHRRHNLRQSCRRCFRCFLLIYRDYKPSHSVESEPPTERRASASKCGGGHEAFLARPGTEQDAPKAVTCGGYRSAGWAQTRCSKGQPRRLPHCGGRLAYACNH